jgi:uncharacterized Fe-S cluster protein YjdI/CDGSH-type Zn-finger protein
MTRRRYPGKNIEVSFDLDQCIHVGECLRRLPETFALDRRPWISPDAANADDVAAVVERCPSGALQYRRLDGGPDEGGPQHATVTPLRNGPLLVRGRIEVRREDGTLEAMPRATLCRCGFSANKPFCDNTHLRILPRARRDDPYRTLPGAARDRSTDGQSQRSARLVGRDGCG